MSSGVFKIEDSAKLAQLWGECKNCPAMNYDKLSRSIRQYYKYGIILKTPTSQRLEYQFCLSYLWRIYNRCRRMLLIRFYPVSQYSTRGDWKRETWHRETGQLGTISQGWTSRDLFRCSSRCSLQVCL